MFQEESQKEKALREAIYNAILCKHLHNKAYVNNYIMSPSATFLQNVVWLSKIYAENLT